MTNMQQKVNKYRDEVTNPFLHVVTHEYTAAESKILETGNFVRRVLGSKRETIERKKKQLKLLTKNLVFYYYFYFVLIWRFAVCTQASGQVSVAQLIFAKQVVPFL